MDVRRAFAFTRAATLRDLATPTLVVHGAADVLPLAQAARIRGAPDAVLAAVHAFLAEGSPDS